MWRLWWQGAPAGLRNVARLRSSRHLRLLRVIRRGRAWILAAQGSFGQPWPMHVRMDSRRGCSNSRSVKQSPRGCPTASWLRVCAHAQRTSSLWRRIAADVYLATAKSDFPRWRVAVLEPRQRRSRQHRPPRLRISRLQTSIQPGGASPASTKRQPSGKTHSTGERRSSTASSTGPRNAGIATGEASRNALLSPAVVPC